MIPTYDTHQRRALEPDGTVHAARYAGDRRHVTTACAVYPAPRFERLEHEHWRTVTCQECRTVLTPVIICPVCSTVGAEEYGEPILNGDGTVADIADCARCTACGHSWGLDPGADLRCPDCGGSGRTGRGTHRDPQCHCLEQNSPSPIEPPIEPAVSARLDQALAAVQGEIARVDNKASLLLAFDGAGLAGLASLANAHLNAAALTLGALAALALGAAAAMLLLVVRPHLGGDDRGSFPYWARLQDDEDLLAAFATDTRPAAIRVLSQLTHRKYGRLARSCDLSLAALALITLAAACALLPA